MVVTIHSEGSWKSVLCLLKKPSILFWKTKNNGKKKVVLNEDFSKKLKKSGFFRRFPVLSAGFCK